MIYDFQAPQKIDPWNEILEAFDFRSDCVQYNTNHFLPFGSEDCLHLNVYVPVSCSVMNSHTKLPVLVYVFGGNFVNGSARFYGPDFFMEANVIVVMGGNDLYLVFFICINLVINILGDNEL